MIFFGKGITGKIARSIDWSKHPLGPVEFWDIHLKTSLSLAMSSMFPMFISWGPERYFFYNDAYSIILGNKHPEAFGKKFPVIWKEIWNDLIPLIETVENGEAVYLEDLKFIMHRKGFDEETYFTFSYSPVRGESGKVNGLFCACVETTGRVIAEREIKKRESELSDILENMSDGFIMTDSHWIIRGVNLQFEKVVGMGRDQVVGKNFRDLFFSTPEQNQNDYMKYYSRVMNERVPATFVDYYEPLNIWTAVSVYPKTDGGMAVFFREITEERRAAQELNEAVIARDEFISIASHELKTPLTSLKMLSQIQRHLANKGRTDAYSKEKVDVFVDKTDMLVNRLDRLIEDMLDISRIRTGRLMLKPERADLVAVAKDVVERFQELFLASSGQKIKITTPPEAFAEFDIMRIEQVIQNLLQNAQKYGEGKNVEVIVEAETDKVALTVKDEGMGILPEKIEKIFERYERGVNANRISGLGLGLYISREIVNSLGGSISVVSAPGEGSAFRFEIPSRS